MIVNLHWIDWSILIGLLIFMAIAAHKTKKYTTSVADFLAANRCAGRYMLGVAAGISGIGAITVVAYCEGYYASGFTFAWWGLLMLVVVKNVIALSGWGLSL